MPRLKHGGQERPTALARLRRPEEEGQVWLFTFTDLVALLVAFFVMLFSMSKVEERKWQSLSQSLSDSLRVVRQVSVGLPTRQLDVDAVDETPALELDYLASILRDHMQDDAVLSGGGVRREGRRLVISLPVDLLFAPGSAAPSRQAQRSLFALGGLLRHVGNRIEVLGSADPTPAPVELISNWELSLARALGIAAILEQAGYRNQIVSRGLGDSRAERAGEALSEAQQHLLRRRVDIVVLDHAERQP